MTERENQSDALTTEPNQYSAYSEADPASNSCPSREEVTVQLDLEGVAAQLQKLTDERDQLQQQVLRTMADFQNLRKRAQSEQQAIRQFANESFVAALLPVLDNFERTVTYLREGATVEKMLEGISAVERQLRLALETQNVRRIDAVGIPFDPNLHEAIATVPTVEAVPDTVVEELEPGYIMADRVIRPARVKVAVPLDA